MNSERVIHGIDASRRAGWRSYYQTRQELDGLRNALLKGERSMIAAEACRDFLKQAAIAFLQNGGRTEDENGYVGDFAILAEEIVCKMARELSP
jgi:hypothetical protein